MIADKDWKKKLGLLDDLAMGYEVAVIPMYEKDYLAEFYDFYRIRNRSGKLVPSELGFEGSLREVSGEYRWEEIAVRAKAYFGLPVRIMGFEDGAPSDLREALGGRRGLSPFFFVFDMMFCEYEGFTLCYMSGTNN